LRRWFSKFYVYQKIIIVFIVLLFSVYVLSIRMNLTGAAFIKEEYTHSIVSKATFFSNLLESQISFIRSQQLQFLNDSDLQTLSFRSGNLEVFEAVQLSSRIRERLSTVQNSSPYILNTGVYVKSFNRIISFQDGISKMSDPEFDIIESYGKAQQPSFFYLHEGRLYFMETAGNGSLVSYLEISPERLSETIQQMLIPQGDSGVFLADGQIEYRISPKNEDQMARAIYKQLPEELDRYGPNSFLADFSNQTYHVTANRISALGLTLYTYMNQNELTGPLKKFNIWIIWISLISVLIVIVFSLSVNRMIHRPLMRLKNAFKSLETDKLDITVGGKDDLEFGYLYGRFNLMVGRLKDSIQENYQQKIALRQSELKQLQVQINPHFLYNSFFTISMMCKAKDYDLVGVLAKRLGSYYQFITRNGLEEVPFHQEYRHAMDYTAIQKIRFSNRVEVFADEVPVEIRDMPVPRLIIQPMIENAFQHAIEKSSRGGIIRIAVTYERRRLIVSVEDDGTQLADEDLARLQDKLLKAATMAEKTGIINGCRRIQLKYGEDSGLFVSRSSLGGLKAELIIYVPQGQGGG